MLRSCCLALGCDSVILVWVASGLVVTLDETLVVVSPLAGLADLPLTLMRGCRSRWGKVGCRSRCVEDVMCAVEDSIDDRRWLLEAST